jgi:putative ABC transport system substrate-binding protein
MTRGVVGFFVTLVFILLVAPLAAAPPAGKVPRIGLLEDGPGWEAFHQGLRDLGYVEGQNIIIESRLTEGEVTPLPELAAELVRRKVDIIVTAGSPGTQAAKQATTTIPIIMASVGDPLGTGFVASLARPGGNITGSTVLAPALAPKRLQLLKEVVPSRARGLPRESGQSRPRPAL